NYSYAHGSNRLTSIYDSVSEPPETFSIDEDLSGNLTRPGYYPGYAAYEYDSQSQLRAVTNWATNGVKAYYSFNHLGERNAQETYPSQGVTEDKLFTYLPDGKVLGETIYRNSVLAEQRDYVWMDNTPGAMHATKFNASGGVTDDQTYYLHADHLDM